jgi:putative intracellular protease/amidase
VLDAAGSVDQLAFFCVARRKRINDMLSPFVDEATTIVDVVLADKPGFYFVSGFGGAGKTFLWNAIIAYLRGQKKLF